MILSKKRRLYRKAKYLGRDISYRLGFLNNFFKKARGSRIVIYHGICNGDDTRFNTIFLNSSVFEAHLKFYKKHFNVMSLNDYYEKKFSATRFNICLTFDDGFANNFKYVLPLLEKYQIPATFFITGIRAAGEDILWNDFLGIASKYGPAELVYNTGIYYKDRSNKYILAATGESLADNLRSGGFKEKMEMMEALYAVVPFKNNKGDEDYWLQMTVEQIKQLSASPLVNIGSHGYYHNDLAKIGIEDAEKELAFSKQYLERIIDKEVKSIAFPYGSYTPEVVTAASAAGYSQLLAVNFLFSKDGDDPAMGERFTINPFVSVNNQMYAIVTRSYD